MRSSRSSLSSSFLNRRWSCSESFSRRNLRISYIAHNSTSSGTRVRGAPCFEELRTYRRVTSVAPSMENAMQYESLRFQPVYVVRSHSLICSLTETYLRCKVAAGPRHPRKHRHVPISVGVQNILRSRRSPPSSTPNALDYPKLGKAL